MVVGISDGLFRSIYEGCLSSYDVVIARRLYYRNCGCALHDKSRRSCLHKRLWKEGCLALDAATMASPSPSPCIKSFHKALKQSLELCKEEGDGYEDNYSMAKLWN
ncbi:hypothetical protein E1A91_D08G286900v1 [Gossypium mustelinum]|uniref:Uncharacterized protein n=1 Tax=Gossypium mustelinum TaxID=34275 RepID=A0A5D2U1N2_GOSMU|nr:hypothetical protein E1A91_D08G286900v1 [Gossypium mustelinum]